MYKAVTAVKVRGVAYEAGAILPDTARYRGVQSLIRRGKVIIVPAEEIPIIPEPNEEAIRLPDPDLAPVQEAESIVTAPSALNVVVNRDVSKPTPRPVAQGKGKRK